jgi:hypothetical protein
MIEIFCEKKCHFAWFVTNLYCEGGCLHTQQQFDFKCFSLFFSTKIFSKSTPMYFNGVPCFHEPLHEARLHAGLGGNVWQDDGTKLESIFGIKFRPLALAQELIPARFINWLLSILVFISISRYRNWFYIDIEISKLILYRYRDIEIGFISMSWYRNWFYIDIDIEKLG